MDRTYIKIDWKLVSFYITGLHKWKDNRWESSILQRCRSIPSKSINLAQFQPISQLDFSYKNMSKIFFLRRAFEVKFKMHLILYTEVQANKLISK